MKYLLDTNIISYAMRDSHAGIFERLKYIPNHQIGIPSIVIGELEYGARNGGCYDVSIAKARHFTDAFEKVPFTEEAALHYGRIRYDLKCAGTPIGNNDMLIAAIALANQAILVTNNTKEFERVEGLSLENWTV